MVFGDDQLVSSATGRRKAPDIDYVLVKQQVEFGEQVEYVPSR
jgi:hypothetical protein